MADLGIVAADIGLPGAGPRVVEQVRALATEIRDAKLPSPELRRAHRDRGHRADRARRPRSRDHHRSGDVHRLVAIRQYAEDWTLDASSSPRWRP